MEAAMSEDLPLISITYGHFVYKATFEFVLALVFSIGVVFLFSLQKFGEPTCPRDENDPTTQMLPKYLATREQYSRAHMLYVSIMVLAVVLLSLLGPRVMGLGGKDIPEAQAALPLFAALVLVGALPNVPWLQDLEKALRRFAHQRAFIPNAARADAARLMNAEFDFSRFREPETLNSPAMRGVNPKDFDRPRSSLEYNWARLSCLVFQIREVRNGGGTGPLDDELLKSYANDVDQIVLRRKAMEEDVAEYRRKKAKDSTYAHDELHRRIMTALSQLYVLLVCGVRLRSGGDIAQALVPFGFRMPPCQAPRNSNLVVVGFGVIAAAAFAVVQISLWAGQLARNLGLWMPSGYFPAKYFEPFLWTASILLVHGTAVAVADRMRTRRINRGTWFAFAEAGRQRIAANYLRVALASSIAGYLALLAWGVLFEPLSLELAQKQAPYALLPAVTGAFFAFHLDCAELGTRSRRILEVAPQALATGFCGFIAANAWLSQVGVSASVFDLPVLVALLNGIVGAALGWYVPDAAETRRESRMSASDDRLVLLKAEALRNFDDDELAGRRPARTNAEIADQPAASAAGNALAFDKAHRLLQGNGRSMTTG
jgi:hypothetical protein